MHNIELAELMESYGMEAGIPREQAEAPKPSWLLPRGSIHDHEFCRQFRLKYPICTIDRVFYDLNGPIKNEGIIRQMIYDELAPYISSGFSKKVESLLYTLRYYCAEPDAINPNRNILHFANGTLDLRSDSFISQKIFCRHRFPFSYDPKAPAPQRWLKFLRELLEPEDILTLQEYMGYCLIPTTKAQKMLMIIGNGGEGKSRIGVVMKALFGENMYMGSLAKVEHNAFARADLENMLVMVDDDMKMEAFKQTNYLKSIITADTVMDLEKKGQQSYQGTLYVRFLGFGNGSIKALHDRSYGFFRRQIILRAKPRPDNRVDDPFLDSALLKEIQGIFLWCLEGWDRLLYNNFQFTISQKAQENMTESITEGCNAVEFMQSRGYFLLDPTASTSSRNLYNVYKDWCDDNSLIPLSTRSFSSWLRENSSQYNLLYSQSIPIGNGKYARGFQGIRTLPRM